jgi:hypothetical protein
VSTQRTNYTVVVINKLTGQVSWKGNPKSWDWVLSRVRYIVHGQDEVVQVQWKGWMPGAYERFGRSR